MGSMLGCALSGVLHLYAMVMQKTTAVVLRELLTYIVADVTVFVSTM